MLKLALIGKDIKHSKSKEVYEKLLSKKIHYDLLDIEEEKKLPLVEEFFNYDGISVTSPYKELYLKDCIATEFAQELKAINCLFYNGKKLYGTNTDYLACQEIGKEFLDSLKKKEVIVFGSGPMSRVIEKVLKENKISYQILSRKNNNFKILEHYEFSSPLFVINCLSRKVRLPLKLSSNDTVWDLNYLNSEILSSYATKPEYFDGEKLLHLQARFALSFWNIKDY